MFILSLKIINYSIYEWLMAFSLLAPQAVLDIKKQSIYVMPNIIVLILLQMFTINGGLITHIVPLIPGAIFIVASLAVKESVGVGDGIIILVLGTMMGMGRTFAILFFASSVSAIVALFLVLFMKVNRKFRIPFVPFILIGTIIGGII